MDTSVNFDAVDRLVEFGLSAAVAQRMVASMNGALDAMNLPGRQLGAVDTAPQGFWIVYEGKPAGPFQEAQLIQLIAGGKLTKASYVWKPGMAQWATVENSPEVLRLIVLAPPPFVPTE
ncbi:DUF4339 domain-containing protein [Massilia sp. 9I]|uniref:DUF4339 domain-containing protein n=1 Tax=Massilia sp. 9I TaxID=2653152 RepID=UPI0012F18265|nr:DUF4339 domain-containing protein [Massilia sp. 9I]VXC56656.1 conserved hypothetical protein [Massilia sp. 9I]